MSDNSMMTQEQIEEMLRNAGQIDTPQSGVDLNLDTYLTKDEQDALGEMGNICMGTAATTMYTLLGKQVSITTPQLTMHTWETLSAAHPLPLVVVEVHYLEGLEGNNLLVLKEYDVALITDLLIGGNGTVDPENVVLDEINLSAIREVMNQMVGSSATSLANMLQRTVNISTPMSKRIQLKDERLSDVIPDDAPILKVAFKMEIEGLLSSEIMQIFPVDFAKNIADELLNPYGGQTVSAPPPPPPAPKAEEPAGVPMSSAEMFAPSAADDGGSFASQFAAAAAAAVANPEPPPQYAPPPPSPYMQPQSQYPQPQYAPAPQYAPQPQYAQAPPPYGGPEPYGRSVRDPHTTEVKEVQYPSFARTDAPPVPGLESEGLRRLMNVPMEVMVELGHAVKTVKEILELNVSSVVVLDKLAGELVEVLVNGVQVARGEVVVIDDNYGVRITELNTAELSMLAKDGEK